MVSLLYPYTSESKLTAIQRRALSSVCPQVFCCKRGALSLYSRQRREYPKVMMSTALSLYSRRRREYPKRMIQCISFYLKTTTTTKAIPREFYRIFQLFIIFRRKRYGENVDTTPMSLYFPPTMKDNAKTMYRYTTIHYNEWYCKWTEWFLFKTDVFVDRVV